MAGSLAAGLAPLLSVLVAGRVVQGVGAALAVPATLSLIGSLYPQGAARIRAFGVMGAMASAGIVSGALIGGAVTSAFGWRWVFLMVVPVAGATAVAAPLVLPEVGADRPRRLDVSGALLGTSAAMLLLYGLTRLEEPTAGGAVGAGAVAAGLALFAAFIVRERRARAPLLRLGILRIRSLRGAMLGVASNAATFMAIIFVGTLYLQTVLGYSPLQAGLALLPVDVVAGVVGFTAGRMLAGRSPRAVTALCFAGNAVAMLWLARAPVPASYAVDVLPALLLFGATAAAAFVTLTEQAVADVTPDEQGLASGIFETANHLAGGAAAVTIFATVITLVAGDAGSGEVLAAGHRAAFLVAAGFAVLGALGAVQLRHRREGVVA